MTGRSWIAAFPLVAALAVVAAGAAVTAGGGIGTITIPVGNLVGNIVSNGSAGIGTVTVSGLPQREDHGMVVAALARLLDLDPGPLMLA